MKAARALSLLSLLATLLLLCACGPSNTVHLLPLKPETSVLPTPTSSTVAVVTFQDKRTDTAALGLRRDKSYFTTMDSPKDWVSRAVADNLASRGYRVTYAHSAAEAVKGQPDFILTGSIEQMQLKETSMTSLETSMRVKYVLSSKEKVVQTETLSASQTNSSVPSGSSAEKLLRDTLKDIVGPMTHKVIRHLR